MKKTKILGFLEVKTYAFFPVFKPFFTKMVSVCMEIRVQSPSMGPKSHVIVGKVIQQAFKLCISITYMDSSLEINYT